MFSSTQMKQETVKSFIQHLILLQILLDFSFVHCFQVADLFRHVPNKHSKPETQLQKSGIETPPTSDVQIRLYDISSGLAPVCSLLLNKKIDAIWHAGIAAYGKEYWFSTHIESKDLDNIEFALGIEPAQIFDMGTTLVSQEDFEDYVYGQLAKDYDKDSYDVFQHNCNHFAADALFYLNEEELPPFITEMFETALSNQGSFKAGLTKKLANQVARVVMIAWERANEERAELQNGVNKEWETRVLTEIEADVSSSPQK